MKGPDEVEPIVRLTVEQARAVYWILSGEYPRTDAAREARDSLREQLWGGSPEEE